MSLPEPLTYSSKFPSKYFCANLPIATNLCRPSREPLVPSSASKKVITCFGSGCISPQRTINLTKTVLLFLHTELVDVFDQFRDIFARNIKNSARKLIEFIIFCFLSQSCLNEISYISISGIVEILSFLFMKL